MTSDQTFTSQNVDPQELEKFTSIAHQWWNTEGEFKPLHQLNPLRLEWINQYAPLSNKSVLDVGCGGGILAESMAKLGANVLGIDLAEKSLKIAKLHALETQTQLEYRLISVESLANTNPASYDIVTCLEMLEHVPSPQSIIHACAALVKPGGWVFFSSINRNLKSFLLAIVGAEYIANMLPRGTHDYDKLLKPSEIAQHARAAGLYLKQQTGIHINPLTQKFYLKHNNVDVNYIMAFQRPS
jgi:2-polyprenyl-6-hydroxyphenyl methylase / 3-demethylubiquinone-9 3-methyltransferase